MRVVSLLPAASEIVCALGGIDQLVGVTHECDYPSLVRTRPRVTRSVVDPCASPAEIDARVRALSASGESLFGLDADRIASLRPDLILTQAICDVCAVSEHDVRALARRLTPEPDVVTLDGNTLSGVRADIARVGDAIGLADEALELLTGLSLRLRTVHLRLNRARADRPRVAVLEWIDPVFAAGHWVPEMVHRAGGVDVLAEAGEHSRPRDEAFARMFHPLLFSAPARSSTARIVLDRSLIANP